MSDRDISELTSFTARAKLPIRFVLVETDGILTIKIFSDKLKGTSSTIPFACWTHRQGLVRVKFAVYETLLDVGALPGIDSFCKKIHAAWEAGK